MKKILLGIAMLFIAITVNASTGKKVTNILIEDIKVTIPEHIGYNEELEVQFSINPKDASNTNLEWDVTGIKKGITVEFTSEKTTKNAEGIISLKINNETEEEVTLKLITKQDSKTVNTKELKVEPKEKTINRVTGEVTELITELDEEITKKNYEDNKDSLEKIDESLEANKEIKDLVETDLLTKYENVKSSLTEYEKNQGKTFTIVISVVLVALFTLGMILIFKKEEK